MIDEGLRRTLIDMICGEISKIENEETLRILYIYAKTFAEKQAEIARMQRK